MSQDRLLQKKYNKLQDLRDISRSSRTRWSTVLFAVLAMTAASIVAGYMAVGDMGPRPGAHFSAVFLVDNGSSVGTGFAVTDRYILTAAHVAGDTGTLVNLSNGDKLTVQGTVVASGYSEWHPYAVSDTQVKEGATQHDWALIEVDRSLSEIKPLLCGSITGVVQGEEIFLLGHPAGQPLTVSSGIISRIESDRVLTDSEIDPGFSGGPMIIADDAKRIDDGIVIGIIVSSPENLSTVREAVSIDRVLDECASAGYTLF